MDSQQNSAGTFSSPANQVLAPTRSVILSSQSLNPVNPLIPPLGTDLVKNKITQSRHEQGKGIKWSKIIDNPQHQSSLTNLNCSKYQNKYSFKRYTREKIQTQYNPEGERQLCVKQLNQHKVWLLERDAQVHRYQVYLAQRDKQLSEIRDVSFLWKTKYRELYSNEYGDYINCLTQIYNISTQAERNRYSELLFVNVSQSVHHWHNDQAQSIRLKEVNQSKRQTIVASLPQNQNRIAQNNGLRQQIQNLQKERFSLIDRIRYLERNSAALQQTVDTFRLQIDGLKNSAGQLLRVQQHLNSKENQLVLAQNHISTLQQRIISLCTNSPQKSKGNNEGQYSSYLEGEIRNLRNTIAKYTEDIEQIELQKSKYLQLLNRREQQSAQLTVQFNRLQADLEQVKTKQVETSYSKVINDSSLVFREEYKSLLLLYGKKTFQSIILLEEINRLNKRLKEQSDKLANAEEQAMKLNIPHHHQEYYSEDKLKLVQEQYNRNLAIVTQKYETEIANQSATLKMRLSSEISASEKEIRELKQQVRQLTAVHEQSSQKNEDLPRERDGLFTKRLQVQKNVEMKGLSPSKDRDLRQLEDKISQLNLQLLSTTKHLKNADIYIEQNLKPPTSRRQVQTQYAQKLVFLNQLTKDFQLLKAENEELSIRLNAFGTISEERIYFKSQYQRLLLVLKQYEQESHSQQPNSAKGDYSKVLLALREVQMHLTEVNPLEQLNQIQNSRIQLNSISEQLQRIKQENTALKLRTSQRSIFTTQFQVLKQKEILIKTPKKVDEEVHVKSEQIKLIVDSPTSTNLEYVHSLEQHIKKLKYENQALTKSLNEKEFMLRNVQSRLFAAEDSLRRQSQLLEVSQRQWRAAQNELTILKEGGKKIRQLEQYLQRAESFIIEEDQKHKSVVSNYENSITQLRGQLEGAEQYIITLEESYNKSGTDQIEYDRLKKEKERINEALAQAEYYIKSLEQRIGING